MTNQKLSHTDVLKWRSAPNKLIELTPHYLRFSFKLTFFKCFSNKTNLS